MLTVQNGSSRGIHELPVNRKEFVADDRGPDISSGEWLALVSNIQKQETSSDEMVFFEEPQDGPCCFIRTLHRDEMAGVLKTFKHSVGHFAPEFSCR